MVQTFELISTDIYPPAESGDFRIEVKVYRHRLDFIAYECKGMGQGPSGAFDVPLYGDDCSSGYDHDHQNATPFLSGDIMWDGCANVQFDEQEGGRMLDFCGRKDAARVGKLFDRLYDIAADSIPTWQADD
jgi:hypothetical protein